MIASLHDMNNKIAQEDLLEFAFAFPFYFFFKVNDGMKSHESNAIL